MTSSFNVTLYTLFLGEQDSVTGQYQRGFVICTIKVAIIPKGNSRMLMAVGKYSRLDAVGFTNYEVSEGDIILDAQGDYWTIEGKKPFSWGSIFYYYDLDLSKLTVFPFISGFFGFEDMEHSGGIGEFEDGFERGYWAL